MDIVFDLPADLPKHRPDPLDVRPSRVLTTWPLGTFVENLLVLKDGGIIVSVHSENRLERIVLDGSHSTLVELPAPPTSLVEFENALFVFGGLPGQSPGYLWRVGLDGRAELWVEIPEALFLNGSAPFLAGSVLAVDSLLGRIYRIELASRRVSVWFAHELLTKITSFPLMPGGNGLKIFDGCVYVSNTDRALLLCVPIEPDGSAGALEVVAEHLRADDFAFDTAGFAYLCTHVENSLVRLSPSGERVALAGPEQGMPGSTAVRFGRTLETINTLLVTATGGLIAPYQGIAQMAKLVAIDVDAQGYPIDFLEAL